MSGYFKKGAWIEPGKDELKLSTYVSEWPAGKSAQDIAKEISDKCRPKLDERMVRIQLSRDDLDKAIDDALIGEHKRLMKLEYTVQRAGFRQRLWYLLTGKL